MGRFDKLAKVLGLIGEEAAPIAKKLSQEETDELIREWAKKKGLPGYKESGKLEIPKAPLSAEEEALEQAKAEKWKQESDDYKKFIESQSKKRREEAAKESTAAGMALGLPISNSLTDVDMNPLKDIKAGYEAYKEFKRPYEEAAGRQFNIAGAAPEVEKPMEMVSGAITDPLMYLTGPVGMGAGALQMGIEALPSESGKETRFDKLKKILDAKKAQERLP